MRTGTAFPTLLFLTALATRRHARAQDTPADTAGIHTALRAFYFSLGHRDWEAIAGQVLSDKWWPTGRRPMRWWPPRPRPAAPPGSRAASSRARVHGAWARGVGRPLHGGTARGR